MAAATRVFIGESRDLKNSNHFHSKIQTEFKWSNRIDVVRGKAEQRQAQNEIEINKLRARDVSAAKQKWFSCLRSNSLGVCE